jgi:acyl-CoA synthetase (AMP-forming)/AMP-acid ligase II
MDKFLTYRELDVLSKKIGAWLQAKGLKKGARVAIMMPNILQYPVLTGSDREPRQYQGIFRHDRFAYPFNRNSDFG